MDEQDDEDEDAADPCDERNMYMSELHELGAVEIGEMIRNGGSVSAVELMEGLLARCDALDDRR